MSRSECKQCEESAREMAKAPCGPWKDEPHHLAFEHAGLPCVLHRGGMGAWCGYVAVPPEHPLHGKDYLDVEGVDVHGGLTYGEPCAGHVCHVPKPGEADDVFWLGFDMAHAFDYAPLMLGRRGPRDGERYRTMDEAKAETCRLAEQLAEIGRAK